MHPNLGVSTGFTGRDCNQQLSINRLPSYLSTKSPIYNSHDYQGISILMIKLSRNRKNIPGVQNLPKMYSDARGSAAKKLSTGPVPSRSIIKKIWCVTSLSLTRSSLCPKSFDICHSHTSNAHLDKSLSSDICYQKAGTQNLQGRSGMTKRCAQLNNGICKMFHSTTLIHQAW